MLHDASFLNKCQKIGFLMLCVVMGYACFAGTASFFSIGPLSIWRVAVLGMALFALPLLVADRKQLIRSRFLWIIVAFGLWLGISALIGRQNGHKTALLIRDIKGFVYFALFPFVWALLKNKAQLRTLMRVMMYACFALGIFTVLFMGLYLWAPEASDALLRLCRRWGFLNFTPISPTIGRFLFVTTPFQLFGCAIPLYFQVTDKKRSWLYPIITGVCLFSILISYTRTLYLSAGVAVVILVLLILLSVEKEKLGRILLHISLAILVLAVIIGLFSVAAKTNYFGYALDRLFVSAPSVPSTDSTVATDPTDSSASETTTAPSAPEFIIPDFSTGDEYLEATKVSDQIREQLKQNLWKEIRKAPILGNGLGLSIEGRETLPELFFLDLWAKTGIVGLTLYLLPYLLSVLYVVWNLWRKQQNLGFTVWAVCLAGLMVYSLFQPYANNAPSILVYCCFLQVTVIKKHELEALSNKTDKEN